MSQDLERESGPGPFAPAAAAYEARRPASGPAGDAPAKWVASLLVLAVFAAFLPILGNGFVNWDDDANFLENPHYRGLGWAQIRWAWTTTLLGVYQPFSWLLLGAQYSAWGLDPRAYHLASLLLHAANAVALYALTAALLARCRADPGGNPARVDHVVAGLAVAFYMVHPMRVEVVAWASCQPYLPSALFSILAVLAYLRAHPDGQATRTGWVLASFLLFLAALLSKAVAIGLPAVLLILDVYPLRRIGPGRWKGPSALRVAAEKLPFVALALIFTLIALRARQDLSLPPRVQPGGIGSRLAQACYGACFYPIKTVLPVGLAAHYPMPDRITWSDPRFGLSALAVAAASVGLVLMRKSRPGLLAAWACYLVLLAPSSGLTLIGPRLVADRYSYVAMMGAVVPIAAGLRRLSDAGPRPHPLALAVLAAAIGLIPLTWRQCRTWRDSEALWAHALAHGARVDAAANANLGVALAGRGKLDEAIGLYAEALRIDPSFATAHSNLGAALAEQGKFDEAIGHHAEAIRLDPGSARARNNLGATLARQGRLDEAIDQFTEALRLDPGSAMLRCNLGSALLKSGNIAGAMAQLSEAQRLDPGNAEAHRVLDAIFEGQNRR